MANSNGVQISINGSRTHYVRDVHITKDGNSACAVGYVSGKFVSVVYDGMIASQYATTDAKPWLRQARQDLVRKYIEIYGDVPNKTKAQVKPTILVSADFFSRLEGLGYKVSGTTVTIPNGLKVDVRGMSQVEALRKIKRSRDEAIKAEQKEIEALFVQLAQKSA